MTDIDPDDEAFKFCVALVIILAVIVVGVAVFT